MIAAYILIRAQIRPGGRGGSGDADLPGRLGHGDLAGTCDVVARAHARDAGGLARLVTSRVRASGGVMQMMSCPAVHLCGITWQGG